MHTQKKPFSASIVWLFKISWQFWQSFVVPELTLPSLTLLFPANSEKNTHTQRKKERKSDTHTRTRDYKKKERERKTGAGEKRQNWWQNYTKKFRAVSKVTSARQMTDDIHHKLFRHLTSQQLSLSLWKGREVTTSWLLCGSAIKKHYLCCLFPSDLSFSLNSRRFIFIAFFARGSARVSQKNLVFRAKVRRWRPVEEYVTGWRHVVTRPRMDRVSAKQFVSARWGCGGGCGGGGGRWRWRSGVSRNSRWSIHCCVGRAGLSPESSSPPRPPDHVTTLTPSLITPTTYRCLWN